MPTTTDAASVLYLRVSDERQTKTAIDIDPEGNSIATQRELGHKKANDLGAPVIETFIEPGVSAKSIESRKAFRAMMAFLKGHSEVRYVIVYARSRAFRNYLDAAIVKRELLKMGIEIKSVREDFGEGIYADAMEGFTDIFNDMQSRLSGEDIRIKMRHKAIRGGTIGRAPLGYLNTRHEIDGHLVNTVDIDELRAPFIAQGFELYATGDYTLERLATAMADRGLTARPSPRHPEERTVPLKKWYSILRAPYYAGYITYQGERYQGRHEPLISLDLFEAVQDVIAVRSANGTRDRLNHHYLRGQLFCQRCHDEGHECRLIYTESYNGRGGTYEYFKCTGRSNHGCDLPHLAVWQVEDRIIEHYATLEPPDGFVETVGGEARQALADEQRAVTDLHAAIQKKLTKLDAQEEHLLDLLADGSLPIAKIKGRLRKLHVEHERLEAERREVNQQLRIGETALATALQLLTHPQQAYLHSSDAVRREINDALYERIYLDEGGFVAGTQLHPAFAQIVEAYEPYRAAEFTATGTTQSPGHTAETPAFTRAQSPNADRALPLRDLFQAPGSNTGVMVDVTRTYARQSHLVSKWARVVAAMGTLSQPNRPNAQHVHKVKHRLQRERIQAIVEAYESPMTANDVARQFGIGKTSVLRILHQHGVDVRPPGNWAKRRRPS